MRLRTQFLIAGVLLAAVLALAPLDPPSARFLLFIGVVTPTMLWILGFTRTPGFVRKARKAAKKRGPLPHADHTAVAKAEYRYPRKRAAQVVLWACALLMGGLTVFTLVAGGVKGAMAVLVLGVGTAMHVLLAIRFPRIVIRVGPEGLESRQLFSTVKMAWEDVVLLANSEVYGAGGGRWLGQTYAYSLHERLTIGDQLVGYAELLAIVEANIRPVELPAPGR